MADTEARATMQTIAGMDGPPLSEGCLVGRDVRGDVLIWLTTYGQATAQVRGSGEPRTPRTLAAEQSAAPSAAGRRRVRDFRVRPRA